MKSFLLGLLLSILIASPSFANLTVVGVGTSIHGTYNLIYDDYFDITWYDFSANASSWKNISNWVDDLSIEYNGQNFELWRLPNKDVDNHLDIESEMSHLYIIDFGDPDYLTDTTPFENLNCSRHWYGNRVYKENHDASTYSLYQIYSYNFYTASSTWWFWETTNIAYGIAVMDGNIATLSTPIPSTISLFSIGLLGFAGIIRKNHSK